MVHFKVTDATFAQHFYKFVSLIKLILYFEFKFVFKYMNRIVFCEKM